MSSPSKPISKLLLAMFVALHATACATQGYFVYPSVSVDELYDDNLFYASEDEKSDFITRVSPELEVGQESDTLSWSGRYRFDAEAYASETDLNSAQVREFADAEVEYLPTNRLTLRAGADYTETDTPSDLSLIPGSTIPGVLVGRSEATRTELDAAAIYRLTARTTGALAFTGTEDELVDVGESKTSVLETWFDQRLSERNILSYGYMYRQYRFDEFGIDADAGPTRTRGPTQDTNTPWIGLSHQVNARTRVVARAGPRLEGSSRDAYVLLSLQYGFPKGALALDYERDETTVLGEPRKLEMDALYATVSRRFGDRLDVQLKPGYAKLDQAEYSTEIYSLGVGAVYKINEAVFLTASYDFNFQDARTVASGSHEVTRNVVQVGVRFTYPRREPRAPITGAAPF